MSKRPLRCRESTFWNKFKPKLNHLRKNSEWDGCMFETFGRELDFIDNQPVVNVWTLLEANGRIVILAGYHWVNRLGYFVTEQSWDREYEFYVDT